MPRYIDANALKRKAQKTATEAWKMKLIAKVETTLNQFIDWIDEMPTVQPELEEFEWCHDCKEYDQDKHYCPRWTKVIRKTVAEIKAEQPDFDTVAKIDKAHDDGYKQGYLQGKADYEPKTGKWIKVHGFCTPGGDPVWACSECGKGVHVYGIEHGTYGADVSDGQWKACPNCGAKMKEGDDHD